MDINEAFFKNYKKVDDVKKLAESLDITLPVKGVRKDFELIIETELKKDPEKMAKLEAMLDEAPVEDSKTKTYVVEVRPGAQYLDNSGATLYAKFGEKIKTNRIKKGTFGFKEVQDTTLEAAPSAGATKDK